MCALIGCTKSSHKTLTRGTLTYACKGITQSNNVCEYGVNLSTNEKVIIEKQVLTQIVKEQCWISRSSEGQGHDATC